MGLKTTHLIAESLIRQAGTFQVLPQIALIFFISGRFSRAIVNQKRIVFVVIRGRIRARAQRQRR
jgi:hypothetical protein